MSNNSNIDNTKLNHLIKEYGTGRVVINRQLLEDDKEKIRKRQNSRGLSKVSKRNLEYTLDYLEDIYKRVGKDNTLELNWGVDKNNNIITSPQLQDIEMFNIISTDYIELGNHSVVSLEYKELSDIVAFEIAHEDLGITQREVEGLLADISIIGDNSMGILEQIIPQYCYEQSKVLEVKSSPYLNKQDKELYNYFVGLKPSILSTYREVVETSCKQSMTLIVSETLGSLKGEEAKGIKVLSVQDRRISYIVPEKVSIDEITKSISRDVTVKTFGRWFIAPTKVTVY